MYHIIDWSNLNDLYKKILSLGKNASKETPKEIERKWLLNPKIFHDCPFIVDQFQIETITTHTWYLSVNPEIRFRHTIVHGNNDYPHHYFVAYKSKGGLVREEIELEVDISTANAFYEYINSHTILNSSQIAIEKSSLRLHSKTDGHIYELNQVDKRNACSFSYMEVEFASEEEANNFEIDPLLSPYIIREVTDDPNYRMANYWNNTRKNVFSLSPNELIIDPANIGDSIEIDTALTKLHEVREKSGNVRIKISIDDGNLNISFVP